MFNIELLTGRNLDNIVMDHVAIQRIDSIWSDSRGHIHYRRGQGVGSGRWLAVDRGWKWMLNERRKALSNSVIGEKGEMVWEKGFPSFTLFPNFWNRKNKLTINMVRFVGGVLIVRIARELERIAQLQQILCTMLKLLHYFKKNS